METITLTKEQLEELIQERMKHVKPTSASIFRDISIDETRDIQPINEQFPTVLDKLRITEGCVNPDRFVYNQKLKKTSSGAIIGHHDASERDIHDNIRKLVLNVFGKTLNKELLDYEYDLAKEFYQSLLEWFTDKYYQRLLDLKERGEI